MLYITSPHANYVRVIHVRPDDQAHRNHQNVIVKIYDF